MKRTIILSITLIFALCGTLYAAGVNGLYKGRDIVNVTYNGVKVTPSDVPAHIVDGRTLVPLDMLRKIGFDVSWDQKTYTADIKPKAQEVKVIRAKLKQEELDRISKSVGMVYSVNAQGQVTSQGSGFVIEGDIFVTNAHVVDDAVTIQVHINGKVLTSSDRVLYNEKTDLAAYKLPNAAPALAYNTKPPERYDVVYAIGYPDGKYKLSDGYVYSVFEYEGVSTIYSSVETSEGASGGLLLSDSGLVVGITTRTIDISNISESTKIKHAIDLLQ